MTYDQFHAFEDHLAGVRVRFYSKPGFAYWNEVSPASRLLAEAALEILPAGRVLALGCGHGAAPAALARRFPAANFWLHELSVQARQASALTLDENDLKNAQLIDEPLISGNGAPVYDLVLMELPKGRSLARRWLAAAWHLLEPGGVLLLGGANDLGIQPALRDAGELFGPGAILAYKKGNRVARFSRTALPGDALPGWAHAPGIAPGTWQEFDLTLRGRPLRLACLPGVFSAGGLDEGSQLLLEALPGSAGMDILDVGCGCGVLGLAAALDGARKVDLVDAFLPAVASTRENIRRLNLPQAHAFASDAFSAPEIGVYQRIITNPPFHAGRAVDQSMTRAFITGAAAHLAPGGDFWLVANRFLPYRRLLEGAFKDVRVALDHSRFLVYRSTNG